jgi:hypothetical protein
MRSIRSFEHNEDSEGGFASLPTLVARRRLAPHCLPPERESAAELHVVVTRGVLGGVVLDTWGGVGYKKGWSDQINYYNVDATLTHAPEMGGLDAVCDR